MDRKFKFHKKEVRGPKGSVWYACCGDKQCDILNVNKAVLKEKDLTKYDSFSVSDLDIVLYFCFYFIHANIETIHKTQKQSQCSCCNNYIFDRCAKVTETMATRVGQVCAECMVPSKEHKGLRNYQYTAFKVIFVFGGHCVCRPCRHQDNIKTATNKQTNKTKKHKCIACY